MAIATAISGMFLFLFTTSGDPNTQLAFSSLEALFQNIMYGVLYAYTPEVFPAPNRGTGSGASSDSFLHQPKIKLVRTKEKLDILDHEVGRATECGANLR